MHSYESVDQHTYCKGKGPDHDHVVLLRCRCPCSFGKPVKQAGAFRMLGFICRP